MDATTIAVDLAKSVFEVAMEDRQRRIIARRRLTRPQFARLLREHAPTHIVMEACGTAHHWGRTAQAAGHWVTLLPPQYVRPFVRRQKTDRTDTTGLLDARHSPTIRPVPVKTIAQQELLSLHRLRRQWMMTRTARINALRGLLAEYGICLAKGARTVVASAWTQLEDAEVPIPGRLRRMLGGVIDEIRTLEGRIASLERELRALAIDDPVIQRLQTVPGIGLITSTAVVGSVGSIREFRRARCWASWLGLTPREHSSGAHRRLGGITKAGDVYLRGLLAHGARSVLLAARTTARAQRPLTELQRWALAIAERRGHNRATIALANKLARIVWAVWTRETAFIARPAAA